MSWLTGIVSLTPQPKGPNFTLALYPGFDPYRSLTTTLEATL
jgi:hypothetical protein